MNVTTVKATIRMSRQVDTRTWGTVELGAEGTLGPEEIWEDSQAQLYDQLKGQLASLWKESHAGQPEAPTGLAVIESAEKDQPVCPTHGTSKASDHGGLYCGTMNPEGSKPKWCRWTFGKPDRRRRN